MIAGLPWLYGLTTRPSAREAEISKDGGVIMKASTSIWAKLLRRVNPAASSVRLQDDHLRIGAKHGTQTIGLNDISDIVVKVGLIWSSIRIKVNEEIIELHGIPKAIAARFVTEAISRLLNEHRGELQELQFQIDQLASGDHYVAHCHIQPILDRLNEGPFEFLQSSSIPERIEDQELRKLFDSLRQFAFHHEDLQKRWNERFMELESQRFSDLFASIEKYPLTEEQRRAVLTSEDNNLVVAAAGSGKTSVIVAKAAYLIEKGLCRPDEILLLSYTKASTQDLQTRIQERFEEYFGKSAEIPKVKTFHALGYEILGQVRGQRPDVDKEATDDKKLPTIVEKILRRHLQHPEFSAMILSFFLNHFTNFRNPFKFDRWKDYVDYVRSQERRTLSGYKVKSLEECDIANFLYLNGIEHRYEEPYPFVEPDREHASYKPDFYLPDYDIYIEHFALDREGRPPRFMTEVDRKKYLKYKEWKEGVHEENGTTLIETFSYERVEGQLLSNLKRKLTDHGVELRPRDSSEVFEKLNELGHVSQFSRLIATFLNHVRSNRRSMEELKQKAQSTESDDSERPFAFLSIFEKVQADYEQRLQESGKIDFHDMINKAADYVEQGKYDSPYSFILVDEFQDISRSRARLLKALASQRASNVLFCVGDDWQSIFRFAGSDVSIMCNFDRHFGSTAQTKLTRTFRLNDKIADFARDFILQNPNQIKKEVVTEKQADGSVIQVGLSQNDQARLLREALQRIAEHSAGQSKVVLLLGRYKRSEPHNLQSLVNLHDNLSVGFRTVHRAKGSEADYVIALGLQGGLYGFPTGITDDPIIELALPQGEKYPNAEERRLFYVAVTRGKEIAFIIGDSANTSLFVEEVLDRSNNIESFGDSVQSQPACPRCKTGRLREKNGEFGDFYGCNHYPCCEFSFHIKYGCPICNGKVQLEGPGYHLRCVNCDFCEPTRVCPSCRSGILVHRCNRQDGTWFKGCTSYPDCKHTEPLDFEAERTSNNR